ncbi:TPA: elongation factor P [Candidatus Dojkabacteria bacterium]|uniref:Elongation factor P n=1 Tax=Candidatus Dojkabacteria bacterium TaxID=2099670 RepID=A0A832R939_9BACT|nr:elongation factor P [Candidatus Dojkabacteria bacterium]
MPVTTQPVKGMYLLEEGRVFLVQERQLKTQGRQGGLIILRMKALDNGQIVNKTIKAGAKVEYIEPETKAFQFLYSDDAGSYFMDSETYETVMIPKDVVGDYVQFLKEGETVLVMVYEGKILTLKENPSVELEVTKAVDAVRGNTSSSATKEVTLETGYKVHVPLFIKQGDIVKINTETGQYTGKAS